MEESQASYLPDLKKKQCLSSSAALVLISELKMMHFCYIGVDFSREHIFIQIHVTIDQEQG